jgi:alkanesulfonate monooxygenase SsuD/methylene tetrahydromethanopterin reductase-like flavin-dependent oxidoreductase (luciferase family)
MQVGIDSFAAAFDDSSRAVSPQDRLQHLVEQIERADQAGLDVFGVGEHHRREFLDSAPAMILAAAAGRTRRIRLTSAVTVLSAADPVRIFQSFATLDLLSHGRAEMVVGRGSSIEAFPLFGFRLEDYDALFAEKLDLLLAVRERERVTWTGRHRAPLEDRGVYPRPLQDPLPVWVAVGGTPESAVRAGPSGSRSRSASSAACPSALRRSRSCTAARPARPGTSRPRSASTRTATSRTPRSRRSTSRSRTPRR